MSKKEGKAHVIIIDKFFYVSSVSADGKNKYTSHPLPVEMVGKPCRPFRSFNDLIILCKNKDSLIFTPFDEAKSTLGRSQVVRGRLLTLDKELYEQFKTM